MADLTAIILTKNEEKNIEKCIKSIKKIAKRIVVIDSYSEDQTVTIAKELGVDVYQNRFINYSNQFNWGLKNTNISTEWILRIDADEEFTEELSDEVNQKLDKLDKTITGATINLRILFMGKWLRHGGMYPLKLLRIFRFKVGRLEDKNMDEHVKLDYGKVVHFKNDFIHHDYKNLDYWIHKHNWYSNREVMDYYELKRKQNESINININNKQAGKKRWYKNNLYYKFIPKFMRAKLYFIFRYYLLLGFLDGEEGKIFHFMQGYWYRFLVDAKIYECEKFNIEIKTQGELKSSK